MIRNMSYIIVDIALSNFFIFYLSDRIVYFIRGCLQAYLVTVSNQLNDVHTASLRKFILSAFDMAREIQITPKRILYAQKKEAELYSNLMSVVNAKQEELTEIIQAIIQDMREEVLATPDNVNPYNNDRRSNSSERYASERAATIEVQRIVLTKLREKVAKKLVNSVNCLKETFVGTLQRCLLSLEKSCEQDINLKGI